MENAIVILIVAVIVGLAAAYVYKEKKNGHKCIGCPGGCRGCSGANGGCGSCGQ